MRQSIVPVISNEEICADTYLLRARAPEISSLAQPGQFIMVGCGEGHDPLLRRPLSIHKVSEEGHIFLLFAATGRGTRWLSGRHAGDALNLLGPLGRGFSLPPQPSRLLLVAGGRGIAPLLFLAERALSSGHRVTLLLGAASGKQLYPPPLLPPEIDLTVVTEDGSRGEKGKVTDLLPAFLAEADQVFACGPLAMYQAIAAAEQGRGMPIQVSLEVRMGCGMGVCYGCTIKTRSGLRQVCQDGPIFELGEILWQELKTL
jgi:dihydroorotate dehydrogenase electron transfer subunit